MRPAAPAMKGIGGSGNRESCSKVKMPAITYSGSVVATMVKRGRPRREDSREGAWNPLPHI